MQRKFSLSVYNITLYKNIEVVHLGTFNIALACSGLMIVLCYKVVSSN